MQVRKFEARTMKDALELVKNQLGPDAIILSAKDNSRGFGLAGNQSVEITAAISAEMLKKKQFAESKLRKQDLEKIQRSSARVQKNFIESAVNKFIQEKQPRTPITRTPYIDIIDDSMMGAQFDQPAGAQANTSISNQVDTAAERIKTAAQRAWNAMNATANEWMEPAKPTPTNYVGSSAATYAGNSMAAKSAQANANTVNSYNRGATTRATAATSQGASVEMTTREMGTPGTPATQEIHTLRSELAHLKTVISDFQKVPQVMNGHHPGSEYGLSFEFSNMFEKLTNSGVAADIAGDILAKAQKEMPPIRYKNRALIDGWVAKYILDSTKVVEDLQGTQLQVFVGPPGSGKTSMLVKLASHYVVNSHKKVALVTTDTQKVGASDQLRIYAQILNIPFAVVRAPQDWGFILQQLRGFDYILCDCAGTGLKSIDDIQNLKSIIPPQAEQATVHLVLSATAKDQDLSELGRRYKSVNFKDVVFTNLDDSSQFGNIYNFIRRFDSPLHSFGIGSRVPEDFEVATRERVLDLIFKLTKIKK